MYAEAALFCVAYCLCAVVVAMGSCGVLRGTLGRGCIFFGELRVSAVWILQAVAEGINRLSLPFLQGWASSQKRLCD